jgi:hypothetical protein
MALDSESNLHVTYWSGGLATTPGTPSHIHYRMRSPYGEWSAQLSLDDSKVGSSHIGGRHPSLAVAADDTVWVVWHDHRHCIAAGSWINNIEVYGDYKTPGNPFTATDVRLTTTNAPHAGDNAYTPKITCGADGRLRIVWYDFFDNSTLADLYLKVSDPNGVFNLTEPMTSMRITEGPLRGGSPSFTVPDLVVDASGTTHLVWAGGLGPQVDLYYGEVRSGSQLASVNLLASGGTDYYDPPHIALAPNGDLWVAYGDDTAPDGENVVLRRLRVGQSAFDAPIAVSAGTGRQYGPDLKVDSQGQVHLVWVDEQNGPSVVHAVFDPEGAGLTGEEVLSPFGGPWARPSLLLGPSDEVYVIFEEEETSTSGSIWFTTTQSPPRSGVDNWGSYR